MFKKLKSVIFITVLAVSNSASAIDLYVGSVTGIVDYGNGSGSFIVSGLTVKNSPTGFDFCRCCVGSPL